jgi:hypothetical protein
MSDAVNSPFFSQLLKGMDISKPRISPVLPSWDLGVVLRALQGPPYKTLSGAPFRELTLKTVFLLAMASGGRRSELKALMFEEKYCIFVPHGAKATLWFNPSFIRKNQRASETNASLIIPALPTGQSQFCQVNCPVRALRIYSRRTKDTAIQKGQQHLFIPIKDVKPGVEVFKTFTGPSQYIRGSLQYIQMPLHIFKCHSNIYICVAHEYIGVALEILEWHLNLSEWHTNILEWL